VYLADERRCRVPSFSELLEGILEELEELFNGRGLLLPASIFATKRAGSLFGGWGSADYSLQREN